MSEKSERWLPWYGQGECPTGLMDYVRVRFRGGSEEHGVAHGFVWTRNHEYPMIDIVAYRLADRDEPEAVITITRLQAEKIFDSILQNGTKRDG